MADDYNDKDPTSPGALGTGGHGEAALLLVESLLHALTERSILTVAEAIDIVGTAVDVIEEGAEDIARPESPRSPTALLEAISASLMHDL